jgi:hypothetical protein
VPHINSRIIPLGAYTPVARSGFGVWDSAEGSYLRIIGRTKA